MKAFDGIGDATVEDYPRGKFALFTVITVQDPFIEVSDAASLAVSVQVIDQAMPRDAGAAGAQRGVEARTVRARHAVSLHTRPSDSRGHGGVVA
jgi:hypothetical protein